MEASVLKADNLDSGKIGEWYDPEKENQLETDYDRYNRICSQWNLVLEDCRQIVEEKKRAFANGELNAFPEMRYEDLLTMDYLDSNVIGDLPKT
jgi:hypothetical protein